MSSVLDTPNSKNGASCKSNFFLANFQTSTCRFGSTVSKTHDQLIEFMYPNGTLNCRIFITSKNDAY